MAMRGQRRPRAATRWLNATVPIEIEPISPTIVLGGGATLDESMDFLLGMGIVRGLLSRVDPAEGGAAIETVHASLAERYEPGVGVGLGSGGWLVCASN